MTQRGRVSRLRPFLASALGGIRGRMIVLLMVAGIPVASIAIANSLQDYRTALDEGRRGVETLRTLMAVRHGVAIGSAEAVLTALAQQDPRAGGNGLACPLSFRGLAELHPGNIADLAIVLAGQGLLCGIVPANLPAQPLVREALTGDVPVYGAFLPAAAGRAVALPVAVPGSGESGDWAVLGTLLPQDRGTYPADGLRDGDRVWLVDRQNQSLSLGRPGQPPLDPAVLARLDETGHVIEPEDGRDAYAATRLAPGLRLVVGRPIGAVRDAARSILLQRVMELATFLVACLAAIVVGADLSMVRPLRLLAARVRAWQPGHVFGISRPGTEPIEVRAVEQAFSDAAAALARREADLHSALEQRDALMAEIHHRVKNNLQIVSSLLNLQAGRIGDPAAAAEFLAARNRVRALATLHRHLYVQHSFEAISLPPFLTELANQQFSSHNEAPGERLALRLDIADVALSTDQAVSLSLLVTEAVGNAVEHAFPDDARGTIWLTLSATEERVRFEVRDDGIGLPDRKDRPRGLGLQLMEGFAKQLGGPLKGGRAETGTGTFWTVDFPMRANPPPRAMAA